ncbi:MAG: type II toxin-antitoxin system VapC family toxin [Chloroflexi bacterium]|nr:type II toxin-antitoxin system VapC family toxin [Chloroflexota bacterium]
MHLLDTDTLTYLHAGHQRVVEQLRDLADPDVGTTIITKIALLRGRFDYVLKAADGAQLLRAQELLLRTDMLLAQMPVVPMNEAAVLHFDRLRRTRGLAKIGRADLLIASIALAHRATLVTRNVRHFRQVPGLQVVNWAD